MKKHNHEFVYRFQATENINSRLACVKCGITLEEFIERREKETVREALGKVRLERIRGRIMGIARNAKDYFKRFPKMAKELESQNEGYNQAVDKLETLKKRILEEL